MDSRSLCNDMMFVCTIVYATQCLFSWDNVVVGAQNQNLYRIKKYFSKHNRGTGPNIRTTYTINQRQLDLHIRA